MPFIPANSVLPSADVGSNTLTDEEWLDLATESTPHNARQLRVRFQNWLWTLGVASSLVDELALAVYEALANVVDHAYDPNHPDPVMHLRARRDDDQLLITVTDQGRWQAPREAGSRGRGLAMMRSLTTEVHLHPTAHGTTVHLRARTSPSQHRVSLRSL